MRIEKWWRLYTAQENMYESFIILLQMRGFHMERNPENICFVDGCDHIIICHRCEKGNYISCLEQYDVKFISIHHEINVYQIVLLMLCLWVELLDFMTFWINIRNISPFGISDIAAMQIWRMQSVMKFTQGMHRRTFPTRIVKSLEVRHSVNKEHNLRNVHRAN